MNAEGGNGGKSGSWASQSSAKQSRSRKPAARKAASARPKRGSEWLPSDKPAQPAGTEHAPNGGKPAKSRKPGGGRIRRRFRRRGKLLAELQELRHKLDLERARSVELRDELEKLKEKSTAKPRAGAKAKQKPKATSSKSRRSSAKPQS
jgi:hypothetical protein